MKTLGPRARCSANRRASLVTGGGVVSSVAVMLALAFVVGGCGAGGDGKARRGVTTLVDGNVTCSERVEPGSSHEAISGARSVSVDEMTFAIATSGDLPPWKVRTGALKGLYVWKAPVSLTNERNAVVELDRAQTDSARLQYDPIDRDVAFDEIAKTVRFGSCFPSHLKAEGEKVTKTTDWAGAIVTREPKICLRLRIVSERNNDAKLLVLPLGRRC